MAACDLREPWSPSLSGLMASMEMATTHQLLPATRFQMAACPPVPQGEQGPMHADCRGKATCATGWGQSSEHCRHLKGRQVRPGEQSPQKEGPPTGISPGGTLQALLPPARLLLSALPRGSPARSCHSPILRLVGTLPSAFWQHNGVERVPRAGITSQQLHARLGADHSSVEPS